MCPAYLRVAGGARAERWKFSRLPSSARRDSRPLMTSSSMAAAACSRYLLDWLRSFGPHFDASLALEMMGVFSNDFGGPAMLGKDSAARTQGD
jgi:hypothetical protein